jgi:hypothetical protein
MADVRILTGVTMVDDRNGNHYWICDVYHTTGAATDILVPNNVISGSELTLDGTRGGDVSLTADDSATDAEREITIASGEATGLKKIVLRFAGTAGMGGGRVDL